MVDSTDAPLPVSGELVGEATQVRRQFSTGADGLQTFTALPFGIYRLRVDREGFQPSVSLIEIRSELPLNYRVMLGVLPIETEVDVTDTATLLNPDRTGASQQIGSSTLRDRPASTPARALIDLVNAQPGWLLEANGVLHPRGAEYGVQYVFDGLPLLDNRSPNFAPAPDIDEVQSMVVRTGGYPAEYGRQLGGVIEVTSASDALSGLHGKVTLEGGSFADVNGSIDLQYKLGMDTFGLRSYGLSTDRYLDATVQQNYTNHGSSAGVGGSWERNWGASDRSRIGVRHDRVGFLVPNETLQQDAGQRQDRTSEETSGQVSFTHLFSPSVLLDLRGSGRDVAAALWSNALSTPIEPFQNRSFREGYGLAAVSVHHGSTTSSSVPMSSRVPLLNNSHTRFSLIRSAAPRFLIPTPRLPFLCQPPAGSRAGGLRSGPDPLSFPDHQRWRALGSLSLDGGRTGREPSAGGCVAGAGRRPGASRFL